MAGAAQLPALPCTVRRPTFYLAAGARLLEAHLLDFSGALYGEAAVLEFRHWIRDQRRFASPAALTRQLERDARAVRTVLAQVSS
jgi:FAD synthase